MRIVILLILLFLTQISFGQESRNEMVESKIYIRATYFDQKNEFIGRTTSNVVVIWNEMENDKIKSQIFKTDKFFVENRNEKKMYLLRKSDLIFNRIPDAIELQNKLERIDKFKRDSCQKQKQIRIAKRTYYYEFFHYDNDYDYKKVEKEHLPIGLVLGKNDFTLNTDNEGLFKGSEITLIDFLDSLHDK